MMSRASCLSNLIMMGAPTEQFPAWLNHVTSWYNALSDDEKNCVLDNLISVSGPHQMYMLSKKFPDLLYRDFVGLLPPEVSVMILQYLEGDHLLACCLVSKSWHDRITNLALLWGRIARGIGVVTPIVCRRSDKFSSQCSQEISFPVVENCSQISVENTNPNSDYSESAFETAVQLVPKSEEQVSLIGEQNIEIVKLKRVVSNDEFITMDGHDYENKDKSFQTVNRQIKCVNSDASSETVDENTENLNNKLMSVRPGSVYKAIFCHAKQVLRGFSLGSTIDINQDFIDKGVWRVTSVRYYKGCVVTGCDDHTVQVWSVPEGRLINTVSTHSVCCLTITDTHLYTASFNANAECWDLTTGLHTRTFCGHTSAVLAIDVTADQHFLLTGSVDKTAKLWDLTRCGTDQLVKTFDDTHMDWVFQVKFLSKDNDDLLFVTCDSNVCCLWRTNGSGHVRSASHVTADSSTKFTSFYHGPENPVQLFACQWTESTKSSAFCEYRIHFGATQIQKQNFFKINMNNMKAFLLGAGDRFAVIMCSISRKDFHVLDIPKQTVIATIATPDFYVLTRNGSTVTLCDTSWLNGFNFSAMTKEYPVFAAGIALNKVMLGTWADFVSKFSL